MKHRLWVVFVAVLFGLQLAARNSPTGDIQPTGSSGAVTSPLDLGADGQITFGTDNTGAVDANQRICIGPVAPLSASSAGGFNAIAIGSGALINVGSDAAADRNICIGAACAIGVDSANRAFRNVALGATATALGYRNVALGTGAACYGQINTALGNFATVGGALSAQQVTQSIAIGHTATNPYSYSAALGSGATATADHQIMLGTAAETVVHPGPTTLTGAVTSGSSVAASGTVSTGIAFSFPTKSQIQSSADGYISMYNAAGNGFTGLRFGGTSAIVPMLKSTGTTLAARLANDSGDASFTTGALTASGAITANSTLAATGAVSSAAAFSFPSKSQIQSDTDGYLGLYNAAGTGFTGLRFGGTTAATPMLKSTGTTLAARLANDSADAPFTAGALTASGAITANSTLAATGAVSSAAAFSFPLKSQIQSDTDGYLGLYNAAGTGFTGLRFGGTSASVPMLKSSGTTLAARLANDSGDAAFTAGAVTAGGNITMSSTAALLQVGSGTAVGAGTFSVGTPGNVNAVKITKDTTAASLAITNGDGTDNATLKVRHMVFSGDILSTSGGLFNMASLQQYYVNITANFTAHATNAAFYVYDNAGQSTQWTMTLPSPNYAGVSYFVCNQIGAGLKIKASSTDVIRLAGSDSTAGGTQTTTTIGACMQIMRMGAGIWNAFGATGTWVAG